MEVLWETPYKSLEVEILLVDLKITKQQLRRAIAECRERGHDVFLGGKIDGAVQDDICFLDGTYRCTGICAGCGREVLNWNLVAYPGMKWCGKYCPSCRDDEESLNPEITEYSLDVA
jgi:hypothetical protein